MQLKKNIATSDHGFIFNPGTGDSFSANPMANEIIQMMRTGTSQSDIKSYILNKYEVDKHQLERDWDEFIQQLRENNLLEQ